MIVRYFDRQSDKDPANGIEMDNGSRLLEVIDSLTARPPFLCELVGENGYNLLIGIGKCCGCAQYSRSNGNVPYLMATTAASKLSNNEPMEFLMGGTPSPVPARYCVPFTLIRNIAVYFLETGNRYSAVEWEEI